MANNSNNRRNVERRERRDLSRFCSFWGLVLSGVAMLLVFLFALLEKVGVEVTWLGTARSWCTFLSFFFLLVAIAVPAYDYVRGRKKAWKIVYWIALVLYILGVVGIGVGSF